MHPIRSRTESSDRKRIDRMYMRGYWREEIPGKKSCRGEPSEKNLRPIDEIVDRLHREETKPCSRIAGDFSRSWPRQEAV